MTTFVLVHGAWHGGWCWDRVAGPLRELGDNVLAPTLVGLEGDPHGPEDVDLTTHVQQVSRLVGSLDDVVLCGHSYGGMVTRAVATMRSDQVTALVYLDALLPDQGQCVQGLLGMPASASATVVAAPHAADFGLTGPDADWVDRMMRPQPIRTFTEPVELGKPFLGPTTYVLATGWVSAPHFRANLDHFAAQAEGSAHQLPGSHDLMIDRADEVLQILAGAGKSGSTLRP